jgi:peptide-methionine (R)-S-oxide reductase
MDSNRFTRRTVLMLGAGVAALALIKWPRGALAATAETFEVTKPDAEWKRMLSPAAYDVLRHEGTERPGSSPLNKEHRKGIFACAGCDLPLYSSDTKFESGTGWPSFYQPLADAIRTREDKAMFIARTEVHCRRCGGHLGHVFDDGPKPTGLRYCMNGVAMKFAPADSSSS